ncbi:hypothetical protein [Spongiibacter sp.]|nr:hypothetical protein [Spongiibacter sp.]
MNQQHYRPGFGKGIADQRLVKRGQFGFEGRFRQRGPATATATG